MLRTRIITAVVLVGAFLLALFFLPPTGWLLFATLIAVVAAWEWGALIGLSNVGRVSFGLLVACTTLLTAFLNPNAVGIATHSLSLSSALGQWFYIPSAVFWLLIAPMWLRSGWKVRGPQVGIVVGLVVILPTWLALVQVKQAGEIVLLAILATIWLADIAAYFSGRRFGRHKLAPSISPGKTWEGAVGGTVAVVLYGLCLAQWLPAALPRNPLWLSIALIAFAGLSIIGDLLESLLKRQAGMKDSSNILPGHGGVLDRIDSLTSTLPVAAAVWHYFSL